MREKRACGVKRGEDGWTKNSVDLGLKGGIKCDGCWIAPWTLLIRGEKNPETPHPNKTSQKGWLGRERGNGEEDTDLGDSKENGLRKQELCAQQGRAFWNDIFQFLMPWGN